MRCCGVSQIAMACDDLETAMATFERLGFALEMIFPADDPKVAVVVRDDVRIQLVRGAVAVPELSAELPVLRPSLVVTRAGGWKVGRAGMQYRDLIPDRQGGRFVASHIRIEHGGVVPDYVHYHRVRLQLIYCHRGWVRLVYEDQGDPFVLREGEAVVQPPQIRHRVLEASAGLEVVELGCPAVHATLADPSLALPTAPRARTWDGQRFVRGALDQIETATGGLARVRAIDGAAGAHDGELLFGFVRRGEATLRVGGEHRLREADAFVVPPGEPFAVEGDVLEIRVAHTS